MNEITLTFTVSDQLCADILCTAIEGGIGYWAVADDIERRVTDSAFQGDFDYVQYTLEDTEGEDDWKHTVTYDLVRKGIALILSQRIVRSDIVAWIQQAIVENDGGYIDSDAADCIVQVACFGELVFG